MKKSEKSLKETVKRGVFKVCLASRQYFCVVCSLETEEMWIKYILIAEQLDTTNSRADQAKFSSLWYVSIELSTNVNYNAVFPKRASAKHKSKMATFSTQ